MSPSNLEKTKRWVQNFFGKRSQDGLSQRKKKVNNISDDPEVKKTVAVHFRKIEEAIVSILHIRLSIWKKMLRMVAWVIKFTKIIRGKLNKTPQTEMLLVKDLKETETVILKLYHKMKFKDAYEILSKV